MNFLKDIEQLNSNRIIIYGAGGLGVDLLKKLRPKNNDVLLVDDFLAGSIVERLYVHRYEEVQLRESDQLIICSRFLNDFVEKLDRDFLVYYMDLSFLYFYSLHS